MPQASSYTSDKTAKYFSAQPVTEPLSELAVKVDQRTFELFRERTHCSICGLVHSGKRSGMFGRRITV